MRLSFRESISDMPNMNSSSGASPSRIWRRRLKLSKKEYSHSGAISTASTPISRNTAIKSKAVAMMVWEMPRFI